MREIEEMSETPLPQAPFPRCTQQYENWVVDKRAEAETNRMIDRVSTTSALIRLNFAHMIYDDLRIKV